MPPLHRLTAGRRRRGPAMKPTDTNELADALASAGIDLKEEEAHLVMPSHAIPGANAAESMNLRKAAELKANHALNPFLNIRVLQSKIRAKAREHNMTLGVGQQQQQQGAMGMVSQDITTFLSLAMRERLAGLVTRSIVLARQRRVGTGMISGEWGPYVKGGDKHQSIVNAEGDALGSPLAHNPLKRSFSTFSNPSLSRPITVTTTSIANETARALRMLAQQELQAETQRLHQKSLKSSAANPNDPSTPSASQGDISGPPTPAADIAPEPTSKKMTAKENKKQQDTRFQEAVAHRAANTTAAMMMGLGGTFGGKKKRYAWMTAGATGGLGGGASAPGSPGVGGGLSRVNSAGDGAVTPGVAPDVLSVWGKRIGEWREDGEKGLGVQIRDWARALEGDGRERKAVVKAYLKMK
ncbi:transcription initiation factor TFIID component TAF4 [Kalaharituber pfeilii]|nr:transcription initiation factor TFIID component TAF4 [Kalaharituber pfeilii]